MCVLFWHNPVGVPCTSCVASPASAPLLPPSVEPQEVDITYQVLKQAGEISGGGRRGATPTPEVLQQMQMQQPPQLPPPMVTLPGGSGGGSIASSASSSAASLHRRPPSYMGSRHASVLTVNAPNPGTASSSGLSSHMHTRKVYLSLSSNSLSLSQSSLLPFVLYTLSPKETSAQLLLFSKSAIFP